MEPATWSYPDPYQLNPHSPYPISLRSILMSSSHLCLGLPRGNFPPGVSTKILYAFSSTLHVQPIIPCHHLYATCLLFNGGVN